MGSVLFVAGLAVFLVCALQVYASKFLKTGPALKALYSVIRHPQYLSLAVSGIGLAILWPRFLVVVLWIAMVLVYYLLAKDEERRMLKQFPESYRKYMERSGMFLPKRIEQSLGFSTTAGRLVLFVLLSSFAIGGAFLLRDYTITHLPLWSESNVAVLPIMPQDEPMLEHRMADILKLEEVKSKLHSGESYLVYFMPAALRHARSHRRYRRRLAIVQAAPHDEHDYRLYPPPFRPPGGTPSCTGMQAIQNTAWVRQR